MNVFQILIVLRPLRCVGTTTAALVFALLLVSELSRASENLRPRGVVLNTAAASPGYTLIAPFGGQQTFLIDLQGRVVHTWTTQLQPSQAAYLLEDGSLLRTAKVPSQTFQIPGGPAGAIQKLAWDGQVLWEYQVADDQRLAHHDIQPLPNGNVLVVAWERKTREQAIAAGRDPDSLSEADLWPEVVLEIQPQGTTGGKIVWEWHMWDHLIQNAEDGKPNFGDPSQHPERIDLNYARRPVADWIHMNSIAYHPLLDQILLSARSFGEIWIIDHSTTTAEAATGAGGKSGKGGDLLYRWGNPFAWFAGTPADQKLFGQHDPHWIAEGLPGAGNILIFNNGSDADFRPFSSVEEIQPPLQTDGNYYRPRDSAFGPVDSVWSYSDPKTFYSQRVSGAQRLPNGNTLICSGETGHVFEVTHSGQKVWDYHNVLGARNDEAENRLSPATTPGSSQGPLGGVALFRAIRYPPEDPAFRNRNLQPRP